MSADLDPAVVALMHAEFDGAFYLAANKDVADAGGDPFAHFLTFGWREGRDPNASFSIRRYLDVNADVKLAGVNAFGHYLTHGRAEGRPTDHGLGFRYEILLVEPQIEERLRNQRLATHNREPNPADRLDEVASLLGNRSVHVTVSHDDPFAGVGGVQLCIRLEAAALAQADRASLHLFPTSGSVTVDVESDDPTLGLLVDGTLIGHFTSETLSERLGPLIRDRQRSFVVHSLIGHAVPRLIDVLRAMGMSRGFYWIHDYAGLCAGYALMRDDVVYCGAPPMSSRACEICAYGPRRLIQSAAHVSVFEAFEMTAVAPSRAAMDLWLSRFPVAPAASVVHPHVSLEPRAAKAGSIADRPLNIAFLGMPSVHKGWPVFTELVDRFGDDPRYIFHHLGARQDPRVGAVFTAVSPTPEDPDPMPAAVARLEIDIVLLWSLWPETFCIAAYEAVAAGTVILTNPDAGNVRDFVGADPDRGRVLPNETALAAFFAGDEALSLSRQRRPVSLADLRFSRMTADLLLGSET